MHDYIYAAFFLFIGAVIVQCVWTFISMLFTDKEHRRAVATIVFTLGTLIAVTHVITYGGVTPSCPRYGTVECN